MTSKTQNLGEKSKKCKSFRMCLNLNDNQFKTNRYSYRSTYRNLMVTANQKPKMDTQNLDRTQTQTYHERKSSNQKRRN